MGHRLCAIVQHVLCGALSCLAASLVKLIRCYAPQYQLSMQSFIRPSFKTDSFSIKQWNITSIQQRPLHIEF
jgi:hypothetical protein